MDALKLVPQLFFDLIGRVVPGSAAIFLYFYLFDPKWEVWKVFIDGVLGGHIDKEYPFGFVTLSLLIGAYLIGHLISPFTKLVQWIGKRLTPTSMKANSYQYDWLRMHKPDSGAHCAKLRAEFTMYNGLTVVFAAFAILAIVTQKPVPWILTGSLLGLTLLMGYRGRETSVTFANSIDHFFKAAKDIPPQQQDFPKGTKDS